MMYTIVVDKLDARYKSGKKRIFQRSGLELREEEAQNPVAYLINRGAGDFTSEQHQVQALPWIKRTNLMTGKEYWECPLTPIYCSPSSHSYWSM